MRWKQRRPAGRMLSGTPCPPARRGLGGAAARPAPPAAGPRRGRGRIGPAGRGTGTAARIRPQPGQDAGGAVSGPAATRALCARPTGTWPRLSNAPWQECTGGAERRRITRISRMARLPGSSVLHTASASLHAHRPVMLGAQLDVLRRVQPGLGYPPFCRKTRAVQQGPPPVRSVRPPEAAPATSGECLASAAASGVGRARSHHGAALTRQGLPGTRLLGSSALPGLRRLSAERGHAG